MNLRGVSLFSSIGIGEYFLDKVGINIIVANELIKKRADCYNFFYPNVEMICGDIQNKEMKEKIISRIDEDCKFLLATPPCQGISTLGKNKLQKHFEKDYRNFLIFDTFEIIDNANFDYIVIENVARYRKMYFPYKDNLHTLEEILNDKYAKQFNIDVRILDAKDFGIPQTRPRVIYKLFKKGLKWAWPEKEKEITLREAIGHLPSLEPGEKSDIPRHYAKKENERAVLALKHTPTGKSALTNKFYYPRKKNGKRIKGFHNTYKRMQWNHPAPARTMYCGSVSSHNNVHPGRKQIDGTYSDPRVLTILETLIVSALPQKINFPDWATDSFIRRMIGEAIPPLMLEKICNKIGEKK